MITNVSGSGIATMSDSSIALNPVIDEPSKPIPSSRAPSSSSGVITKLFRCPSRSVNHRSIDSTPSSLQRATTFRRASSLDVARFFDSTCAMSRSSRKKSKSPERGKAPHSRQRRHRTRSAYRSSLSDMPVDLDSAEIAAYVDAMGASPEVCEVAVIGGATCLALRAIDSRMFNRVVGLASTEPLDEIAAFSGGRSWWGSDSFGLGPARGERGFVRDYGWMKFSRGVGPRKARSDLHVVQGDAAAADDFARVIVGAYGLPESTKPLAANVVGRPRWSCFVAYDGDAPAGAGAVFVDGATGWLGMAGTLPAFRSRGAQSVILAARVQGCTTVVTETGELEQGRPSASYRNILRAGFREAGIRPNYRAP